MGRPAQVIDFKGPLVAPLLYDHIPRFGPQERLPFALHGFARPAARAAFPPPSMAAGSFGFGYLSLDWLWCLFHSPPELRHGPAVGEVGARLGRSCGRPSGPSIGRPGFVPTVARSAIVHGWSRPQYRVREVP